MLSWRLLLLLLLLLLWRASRLRFMSATRTRSCMIQKMVKVLVPHKEGNGNFHMVLRSRTMTMVYIRNV